MSNQGSENSLIISSAEEHVSDGHIHLDSVADDISKNMTSNDCDTKSKQTFELETSEETKNKTSDDCDLNSKELPESESSEEENVDGNDSASSKTSSLQILKPSEGDQETQDDENGSKPEQKEEPSSTLEGTSRDEQEHKENEEKYSEANPSSDLLPAQEAENMQVTQRERQHESDSKSEQNEEPLSALEGTSSKEQEHKEDEKKNSEDDPSPNLLPSQEENMQETQTIHGEEDLPGSRQSLEPPSLQEAVSLKDKEIAAIKLEISSSQNINVTQITQPTTYEGQKIVSISVLVSRSDNISATNSSHETRERKENSQIDVSVTSSSLTKQVETNTTLDDQPMKESMPTSQSEERRCESEDEDEPTSQSEERRCESEDEDEKILPDSSIFRSKYVYVRDKPYDGPRTLNITIFGLHEKSGLYIFEKIFKGTVKGASKIQGHTYEEKNGVPYTVSVIVRPSQYADHLFYKTAFEAFRQFDEIASFLLVFDANFVRFSSDVKSAMIKFEKLFGESVWNHTTLIILNSDDVLDQRTLWDYLNREGNNDLKSYADRMGGGVISLPTYDDDYDLEFQRQEILSLINRDKSVYQPGKKRRACLKLVGRIQHLHNAAGERVKMDEEPEN